MSSPTFVFMLSLELFFYSCLCCYLWLILHSSELNAIYGEMVRKILADVLKQSSVIICAHPLCMGSFVVSISRIE